MQTLKVARSVGAVCRRLFSGSAKYLSDNGRSKIPAPRHIQAQVEDILEGKITSLPTVETSSFYHRSKSQTSKESAPEEPIRKPLLAAGKIAYNYIQKVPKRPSRRLHYEVRMRFARWGRRNNVVHGLVVALNKKARDGRYIEVLGSYNPEAPRIPDVSHLVAPLNAELDVERIKYWLGIGARPTKAVYELLAKAGIVPMHPDYLHKTGKISYMDKTTWDVHIRDPKTKETIAVVPNEVAQMDEHLWRKVQPQLS